MSILLGSPVKRGISKVLSFPVSSLPLGSSLAMTRKQRQMRALCTLGMQQSHCRGVRSCPHLHREQGTEHQEGIRTTTLYSWETQRHVREDQRTYNWRFESWTIRWIFPKGCHLCEYPVIHIKGVLANSYWCNRAEACWLPLLFENELAQMYSTDFRKNSGGEGDIPIFKTIVESWWWEKEEAIMLPDIWHLFENLNFKKSCP